LEFLKLADEILAYGSARAISNSSLSAQLQQIKGSSQVASTLLVKKLLARPSLLEMYIKYKKHGNTLFLFSVKSASHELLPVRVSEVEVWCLCTTASSSNLILRYLNTINTVVLNKHSSFLKINQSDTIESDTVFML
jgi:hypothetical protein